MELKIPLPTNSDGRMSKTLSYRWCRELHTVLEPLKNYKLADGGRALYIQVAASPTTVAEVGFSFESTSESSRYFNLKDHDTPEHIFVCRIMMMVSRDTFYDVIFFNFFEFSMCDGEEAMKKFARVIEHLEEHAVPQIAPEWIKKTLEALQGK